MNTETKISKESVINFAIAGCVGIVIHLLFREITQPIISEYGSGCISTTMQLITMWAIVKYLDR